MTRLLAPYRGSIYALLRIVAGVLFSFHGFQKLFGAFGAAAPAPLLSQMGVAGVIEGLGGVCIAVGLFTSPIAFLASGQMAVAYFQAHAPRSPLPITNGGELAALFCWVFLYIAATGTGQWGVHGRSRLDA